VVIFMSVELWLWSGYIFVMGLVFGSFFNVVGIRVPEKETLFGRSKCPHCQHQLGPFELVPIIGYLFLRGRCKNCKSPISVKYPLMELITGILFLFSFVILHQNMVEYILIVVFISLMIIITVSDLYYNIIPDVILLVFFPVILGLRLASPVMIWYEGLIGAVIGFLFMYLMALFGKKRFKQEALGGGDVKLYVIIGLVLGYNTVFMSVLFAGVFGILYYLIFRPKGRYLPFVPFIFAGTLVAYFTGPQIIDWYVSLFL